MSCVTLETGRYTVNQCCVDCTWFKSPYFFPIEYEVCPRCGGRIERVVGRFTFRKEKRLFGTE